LSTWSNLSTKPTQLATTFVFVQWWAFENESVPRDQTLNEDKNL